MKKQNKLKVSIFCIHPEEQIIQYFAAQLILGLYKARTPLLEVDKTVHCMSKLDIIVKGFHMKHHTLIWH